MTLTDAQNTHLKKLAEAFGTANAEAVAKDSKVIRALGASNG